MKTKRLGHLPRTVTPYVYQSGSFELCFATLFTTQWLWGKISPGVVKSSTGNSSYFVFQKYVLSNFMLQHNYGLVKSYIYCLHQWLQNLLMLCEGIFQMFANTGPEEKCYNQLK